MGVFGLLYINRLHSIRLVSCLVGGGEHIIALNFSCGPGGSTMGR